jgi:hypothetical protein
MSKPSRLVVVLAMFAFGVACGSYFCNPAVAQDKPKEKAAVPAVAKWEYRIVVSSGNDEDRVQKELNKLGEEGFEIAFVTGSQSGAGARTGTGQLFPVVHYSLKRAKQ